MRTRTREDQEVRLSITPLIDVTFLLLIFFMCAMKFKTLERKVAAFLPTDRGVAPTDLKVPVEPTISVRLSREPGATESRIKFLDASLGAGETAFGELGRRIAGIRSNPVNQAMPGEIDATAEVPHEDVIRCIDAFVESGLTNIRFVGAPKKGSKAAR